ncbi:Serine/threonine-protein kinase B [Acaryochloris thomasi RCC1774]|uniref:non-specific serine/threonine protein kinase n=1 Tax=Acaryochloris thomasi RCC1774 TaxID=1764569 RepID=A0A2W1JPE9_9CYAN|nr:FHA domain-containing serine/threonine-protein kinase [Acaryochloris thomasi]PZD72762.1 Serine/threonine-protein kinase B [Acaryochloris thomasi RCC1774]
MITLILLDSEHQQWQFELHARVKVGRALDNDVVLADEQVSRYHLELSPTSSDADSSPAQKGWQLQGLGTNGTLVNGKFVTQADIVDGDLIQLGLSGPVLRFELSMQELSSVSREAADCCSQALDEEQQLAVNYCAHENNEPGNRFCIHCGELLQARETVGHFQVVQILEFQEREAAFLVQDLSEKASFYVLRRFKPEIFSQAQARFEQEVLRLRAFNHPGVVKVVDFLYEGPYRYVVMEHLSGVSLKEWVRQERPTVPIAIKFLLSMGDSLEALHSHESTIIHQNLTPSNVLIRPQGQGTVLTNFGSLRAAGFGTFPAVPPTVQSDVYRLGSTLLFLLTGQEQGQYFNVRRTDQHIEWTALPQVPFSLRSVIERMTHPDLQARYRTVSESMEALQICQSE